MRTNILPLFLFSAVIASVPLPAANKAIPIWPNGAPGPKNTTGAEKDTTTSKDGLIAGRPVIRLGNVGDPTITLYQPKDNNTGAAVVVFPGGGYRILAMDLEGTEVCQWLNSIGITGILLKYRVPEVKGQPPYAGPLQDAQRAMGIVREHAKEWRIDPQKIGVLGFSAGGNLGAEISNSFDKRTYEPIDKADRESCRPDFAILIYPAYLAVKNGEGEYRLAPELHVTANTPPTFLVQTEDDPVHVENSLYYYLALKNAKVPAEMHLYSTGGHGYGLRKTDKPVTGWPRLAEQWMRSLGMLQAD
ncbi:MAG TPA: alpha/beta hydrolase [Bryobacteraceae bacterium]|nr:alpha/beta hydrolase [Bryobacteraceae bacterium]